MTRTRYRFAGQAGGRYFWESVLPVSPGDSRYDHVSCDVGVFWTGKPLIHGTCENEAYDHEGHLWGGNRFYCDGDVGQAEQLLCQDGRGAVIYRVAGASPRLWRIRAERYPDDRYPGWFGGKVLWGHDKSTLGDALAVARAWTERGELPEGISS